MPDEQKVRIVRIKANPAALYGSEACPANRNALGGYRAAVTTVLAGTDTNRSADLVFSMAQKGKDVDPEIDILLRRISAVRRFATRSSRNRKIVDELLDIYHKAGFMGTYQGEDHLRGLKPAPHPKHPDRRRWDPEVPPKGPIALLLHSINLMGCSMDTKLTVHCKGENRSTSFRNQNSMCCTRPSNKLGELARRPPRGLGKMWGNYWK